MSLPVDCCEPRWRPSPSGGGWFHELNCTRRPGARVWVDEAEATKRQTERLKAVHEAETAAVGVPTGRKRVLPMWAHPSCYAAYYDGGQPCSRCAWLLHPAGCKCDLCGYSDAHVDERVH